MKFKLTKDIEAIPGITVLDKICPKCKNILRIIKEWEKKALTCPSCEEIIELDSTYYEEDKRE